MDRSTTIVDLFVYPEQSWSMLDLAGYQVEAIDGNIGAVDDASYEIGSGSMVIDTGPWIFGRKVMLPAGVITRIDEEDRRLWVDLTKEQVKNAPDYDETRAHDPAYLDSVGTHFAGNRPVGPDYGKDDRGF